MIEKPNTCRLQNVLSMRWLGFWLKNLLFLSVGRPRFLKSSITGQSILCWSILLFQQSKSLINRLLSFSLAKDQWLSQQQEAKTCSWFNFLLFIFISSWSVQTSHGYTLQHKSRAQVIHRTHRTRLYYSFYRNFIKRWKIK